MPRRDGQLDRLEREAVADQRHRLHQEEVGRVVLEDAREQPERRHALGRVDVAVDGERDRALAASACLLDGLPREVDAHARDVHPVRRAAPADEAAGLEVGGAEDRPGVRRDDVAADVDVAAVDVEDGVRRVVEGPGAPEAVVATRGARRRARARARWRWRRRGWPAHPGRELRDALVGGRGHRVILRFCARRIERASPAPNHDDGDRRRPGRGWVSPRTLRSRRAPP